MEANGVIEPIKSPWASSIVLVKIKIKELRFCIDFRPLNKVTVTDSYSMPDITETLSNFAGAKVFTVLDLKSGYWQVKLAEKSRKYTAFRTPIGLYQFKVMPFGLKNAPRTFQRLMREIFRGSIGEFCDVYIDDVIIYSNCVKSHVSHVQKVLTRLSQHGLTINIKKSKFAQPSVNYLGHVIDGNGISQQPERLSLIENFAPPNNKKELRQFIGTINWFANSVQNLANIISPLTELLKDKVIWKWGEREGRSFKLVKQSILQAQQLKHPDFTKEFVLQTDASGVGLGAVLYQEVNNDKHIIMYASCKLNNAQRNYHATARECLAVLWAVRKFRIYLESQHFKLVVDNRALLWLHKIKDRSTTMNRWAMEIDEYDFDIEHKPGSANFAADGFSRNPVGEQDNSLEESNAERLLYASRHIDFDKPVSLNAISEVEAGMNVDLYTDLIRAQKDDPHCRDLMFKMQNQNIIGKYRLDNGLVKEELGKRLCTHVPTELRENILFRFHDDVLAGHPGRDETIRAIKDRFVWPGLFKDVRNYVQSCEICATRKAGKTNKQFILPRKVNQKWEIVAIDLMGPYPRTPRGKVNILVVTDLFSRWVEATALGAASVNKIISVVEGVFSRFGYPRAILSDNGSQFGSKMWKDACKRWQSELWTSPIYHPQANPTERRNQEFKKMLRITLNENHRNWDVKLDNILFSLRDRMNNATRFSPAEIIYGEKLKRPGDWQILPLAQSKTLSEFCALQKTKIDTICDHAKSR